MDGVAFNVEGGHISGSTHSRVHVAAHTRVEEKSQAVDQVRLPRPSCSTDYQPKWCWVVRLGMLSYEVVRL